MIWFSANKHRVITGQHYKQDGTVYETKTEAAMVNSIAASAILLCEKRISILQRSKP